MLVVIAAIGAACALVFLVLALRSSMAAVADSVQDMFSSTFSGITGEGEDSGDASAQGKIAFAVYSADDQSLNFYKRDRLPSKGTFFHGKIVTDVYSDFEHQPFYKDTGVTDRVPVQSWANIAKIVERVEVVDFGIRPDSLSYWFYCFENMKSCDISKLNTSQCTRMNWTWLYCTSLSSIDVSGIDTSSVTSLGGTFDCTGLREIDVSGWDVSKVTDFDCLFAFNSKLTSVTGLASWDVSSGRQFGTMFRGDMLLENLSGLEKWNVSQGRDFSYMFVDMASLTSLDLSGWKILNSANGTDMFRNLNSLGSFLCGDGWTWPQGAVLPCNEWVNLATGQSFASNEIPNGAGFYEKVS